MSKKWTNEEIEYLKSNYKLLSNKIISKNLNRNTMSVRNKACDLKITEKNLWLESEDNYLREFYNKKSQSEISKFLKRTMKAVGSRAFDLGLCKKCRLWTEKEIEILKENYSKFGTEKTAKLLNRKESHIRDKAGKLKIKNNNPKNKKHGKNNHNWKGYKDIPSSFFNTIKTNAEKRKISFDLKIEDIWDLFIKQNKKCALSGIELYFSNHISLNKGNASLDRIDSSKGYTKGNIQWVHKDINIMKMDLSQNQFIDFCHKISKYQNAKISN